MKPKLGAKASPKVSDTICDIPRELYLHWMEVVFNEVGWRQAAFLLGLEDRKALNFIGGGSIPRVDPNELERAYVTLRYMRFDLSKAELACFTEARKEAYKESVGVALDHQSSRA